MAKKVKKKVAKKAATKKPKLFYIDMVKLQRAKANALKPAEVKKLYEEYGGLFTEGYGIEPV